MKKFLIILLVFLLTGCSYGVEDNSSLDASEVNSSLVNEDLAIPYEESTLFQSSQKSRLLSGLDLYEADNYIVYSYNRVNADNYNLYLYNKKTGENKRIPTEGSRSNISFSIRGNTIAAELRNSKKDEIHLINLDNDGNVISIKKLPFTSKNWCNYTIYGDSIYYVKRYNIEKPNETYEFLRCDLSGENEELIRSGVKNFGVYDDGFYLLEEHAILKFDPETNAVSKFYENKEDPSIYGIFKDNGLFTYTISFDSVGVDLEPGTNVVDLKTGKHYDIIPSFADEWWMTLVFGRDDENFYFDMYREEPIYVYTVYSYNIATGEIKPHKEISYSLNLKNYKGETLENKDRTARVISSAGTKRYYIYNDDIYFENLIKETDHKTVSMKLIQDFLLASEVKPFEEGDTVAVDPFLKYFQFSELLTDKSEIREIYSSYKVSGSSDSFSIPKKIVHEQLKKHFSVNFDDSESIFQDKDNKDCYYLRCWVLGSDSIYQGQYIKEEKVDNNRLLCTYDKMSKKSYYVGDSECPEYEFTKIGEIELLIENSDTPEYKVIYYKESNA